MKPIILEALGNVDGFDAGCLTEGPGVEDEFVRAAVVVVGVEDLVVRLEAREEVVGVEERQFGGVAESIGSWMKCW